MPYDASERPGEPEGRAARWSLASDYVDARGNRVSVPERALEATIAALTEHGEAPRTTRLPRNIVFRPGDARLIMLPASMRDEVCWSLTGPESANGKTTDRQIELPTVAPAGVYRLEVSDSEGSEICTVILAPGQAYQGAFESPRLWLLAVQLYGIRSGTNWGHGDFGDLSALLSLAAEIGAAGIGLNPLHALLNDNEENVSPYSPSSRLFLNYLYIDVEAIPEFGEIAVDDLAPRIAELRQADLIDYLGVASVKDAALRRCHARFRAKRADGADFERFRDERGHELVLFAQFEAARRLRSGGRSGVAPSVDETEVEFHEYVQWRADQQLRGCRDRARALGLPIGLYLDLAVGVRSDGADVHSDPESYLGSVAIGAPPDALNVDGQNWGLTAYHPFAIEAQLYSPVRRMLSTNMRHAGALRVDHVLWLNRVFLVPPGFPPRAGCYIHYSREALLALLALESDAHRCIVVGEDLGTVPPELRQALNRWGIWTYHVMQFERDDNGAFKPAESYQQQALATFSTHDLAPFAAWISGRDLQTKRNISIDPGESEEERGRAIAALRSAASAHSAPDGPEFLRVAAFLGATPSRLVAVSMEEALGLSQLTNIPGTTTEHPNWRVRIPVPIEALAADQGLHLLSKVFAAAGRDWRRQK